MNQPPLLEHAARRTGRPAWRHAVALGSLVVVLLGACAAPAEAPPAAPPGPSLYVGWQLFQDSCSGCHGVDARGTARGIDLLPLMAGMGPSRFASLVLYRYEWSPEVPGASSDAAQRRALVREIVRRRRDEAIMPAWQDDAVVKARIADLDAFLRARAEGRLGTQRPRP